MLNLLALLSSARFALAQSPPTHYTVTPILARGNYYTSGNALNNVGQVAGRSFAGLPTVSFLWQNGIYSVFDAAYSFYAINDAGNLVGEALINNTARGILWQNGILSTLDPSTGFLSSEAFNINTQGTIVGRSYNISSPQSDADFRACIWQNGLVTSIGTLPGYPLSSAAAINSQNQVVGTCLMNSGSGSQAFIWCIQSGMRGIGFLPNGTVSGANALNSAGKVVGNSNAGSDQPQAFLWTTNAGMNGLGTLPGDVASIATGINDSDQIVGYSTGLRIRIQNEHRFASKTNGDSHSNRTLIRIENEQ